MTSERWEQIEKIFDAALKLDPDRRTSFLDQACDGDIELRREVVSLLASDEQAGSFLAGPATEIVTKVMAAEKIASAIGQRIGHYQTLNLLGAGGMGEVYLAEDTQLKRKVAIKLLPVEFTTQPERVRRFIQEARSASALNHPNIITIHEIGETPSEAGVRRYIVTEYVEGETLRQRMAGSPQQEARPIGLLDAIDIASQVTAALTAAHEAGITHRDIKPENVMVRRDGIVKVLDFGLAKLTEPSEPVIDTQAPTLAGNSTEAGVVMGTPRYMSPEQARGEKVDARTDIFSLGVMLYEIVAGQPPFTGATTGEVIAAILRDAPPPLSDLAPDAPPELDFILRRALRKDREGRYQAASELLADLKRLKRLLDQNDEPKDEMAWDGQTALVGDLSAGGEAAFFATRLRQAKEPIDVQADRGAGVVVNERPRAFLAAMAALVIAIFFYAFTCVVAFRYGSTDKFGYRTRLNGGEQTVREVHERSPAAGRLEVGDRIVALNGDERFNRVEPYVLLQTLPEGESYILRVRRVMNGGPAEMEFTLGCTSYPTSDVARWQLIWTHLLRAVVCLAVAFLIIWLKPGERFSLLAFCAFLTIGMVEARVVLNPLQEQLTGASRVVMLIFWAVTGGHLFVPFAYQTAYMFPPEAFRKGRFWSALQWLLYGGFIVGASRVFVSRLFGELPQQLDLLYLHATRFAAIKTFADWYYLVGLVAISAVLARNFISVKEPQQRRRIKWVVAGTLVATVSLAAVEVASLWLESAGHYAARGGAQFKLLAWAANALALAFPLSWAYAILNRRIYDVRFVIRRSLQYLLAKNALRLLLTLPLIGFAVSVYANRDRTLAGFLLHNSFWFYASLIAAVALGLAYRYNLREWLDRHFFREAYQQDTILRELTEEVRHLDSFTEIARRVSRKVDAALHPDRLYLFYREEGRRDLALGYSSGEARRDLRIPVEFEMLRFLEYQAGAQSFPFPAKTRLPSHEKQWLANLGASLIVPMSGADGRLQGMLVLGSKKSETPYSRGDEELLEMMADQIALVYENFQLKKRLAGDWRIRHAVHARPGEPASYGRMSDAGEASLSIQTVDQAADTCSVSRAHQTAERRIGGIRMRSLVAACAIAVIIVGAGWLYWKNAKLKAAKAVLPRIEELAQAERFFEAYDLAIEAQVYLPNDPTLTRLMRTVADDLSVVTDPPGAQVYLRRFPVGEPRKIQTRQLIGVTPINHRQIARGAYLVSIEKEGYASLERSATGFMNQGGGMVTPSRPISIETRLMETTKVPPRMVFVPGGDYRLASWARPTDKVVLLDDYFIDKYEVTNREYKEFISANGYLKREFWRRPIVVNGREVAWEVAVREFKDRTSLSGPRSWTNQDFPEGKAEHPVTDISWYEAAAYAAFRGKELPTVFQWERAARGARIGGSNYFMMPWGPFTGTIERRANFSGRGTMPVDSLEFGLSPFGCYHMAGNVAEWCRNDSPEGFIVTGGSWEDPPYLFGNYGPYPGSYSFQQSGLPLRPQCAWLNPGSGLGAPVHKD